MSSPALEAYLARLYTDAAARTAFLGDPVGAARAAGLDSAVAEGLAGIDRTGLVMAAASLGDKVARRRRRGRFAWLWQALRPARARQQNRALPGEPML
jgi:hypothetical protein